MTPSDTSSLSSTSDNVIIIVVMGVVLVLIIAGVIIFILIIVGLYFWRRSEQLKQERFNMTQNELYKTTSFKVSENAAYGASQKENAIYEDIDDI